MLLADRYAEAVWVLDGIPEHLVDTSLFDEATKLRQTQAANLLQKYRYDEAATILSTIPEYLRDAGLFREVTAKRDRINLLNDTILYIIEDYQFDISLSPFVTELLRLQPDRDDLTRMLAEIQERVPSTSGPALLTAPFDAQQARQAQEAWAQHLGMDVEVANSLGMKFRVIPPGTFDMGSPESELGRSGDETLHKVKITEPKLLGVYPVTQGEWTQVLGGNPAQLESRFGADPMRFPVDHVSWKDCQEFLNKLNEKYAIKGWRYRLPTEAEWEYTCRADTVTPFWFGTELGKENANCGQTFGAPFEVGQYSGNPFGLHDQHGHVWEWCADFHDDFSYPNYPDSLLEDPQGWPADPVDYDHVIRGGSAARTCHAVQCRSANRGVPSIMNSMTGLRVLCELSFDHPCVS
ncbi:MAG: formylglycine-generating enzyme family protein [Planctomycetaceae bacterium]